MVAISFILVGVVRMVSNRRLGMAQTVLGLIGGTMVVHFNVTGVADSVANNMLLTETIGVGLGLKLAGAGVVAVVLGGFSEDGPCRGASPERVSSSRPAI